MHRLKLYVLFFILASIATSCYRMPGDDEYSTIPCINNPDITRAKEESAMPQMKY